MHSYPKMALPRLISEKRQQLAVRVRKTASHTHETNHLFDAGYRKEGMKRLCTNSEEWEQNKTIPFTFV